MILGIFTSEDQTELISQYDWVQHYNFVVVTERLFESVQQVKRCNKPKLYNWLRQTYGNVVVVGYTLVDSRLTDVSVTYKLPENKLLQGYSENYLKNQSIMCDISSSLPEEVSVYFERYASVDMKEGNFMENIEDSLKKAMADLGLDSLEYDDEESAPLRRTVAEQTADKQPIASAKSVPSENTVPTVTVEPHLTTQVESEVSVQPVEISCTSASAKQSEDAYKSTAESEKVICKQAPVKQSAEQPIKQVVIPKEEKPVKLPKHLTTDWKPSFDNAPEVGNFMLLGRTTAEGFELLFSDDLDIQTVTVADKKFKSIKFCVPKQIPQKTVVVKEEPVITQDSVPEQPKRRKSSDMSAYISQFQTLEELVIEKRRLDFAIADNRIAGDSDKVEELKRYRRQVRQRIRNWG